ncbi:type IV prepilin-like proteins leader peptide-processing enzyme [Thioploca ingrica]|uniref:Prepilin leader peptidase/N-methyltransferase n=1 Tax=Thioploca ingrica TaxID=40754 RepID=A0A090AKT3_9GAMM|nr:type IV prepilin-like proteins leader peptide-processing enzyme [Thioploca ingrica]
MEIFSYLASDPNALIIVVGLLGLIIGSFLNVVIYRLPIMMQQEARLQCAELLNVPASQPNQPFNLIQPRSHCPHCGHQVAILENIPLVSFIWQRGQCTACHQAISWRYPFVELLSASLAIILAWQFGFTWQLLGALTLTWILLALSMIDFDHQLLPDSLTLPGLWLGLGVNLFNLYTNIETSVIGAIAGYLFLWSIYWVFKLLTGKEGMGYGDFKLLALLGAWLGWQPLPSIILISSFLGALVGISLIIIRQHDKNVPIPFGPYLAFAGWIYLLWGEKLTQIYFTWLTYP